MKKILITGTGGDVAAGIVKCILSDMTETALYSCDIKEIVPYLDMFKQHFIIPRYDSSDYWQVIKQICTENNITHFFPTTEPEIIIANKNRAFFNETGIILVINNQMVPDVATSKYKTAEVLRENGIRVPDTYLPDNLPENPEFPLIVKPDFGRGSAHLTIVNNRQELETAISSIPSPVIQQYIGSDEQEFTVGVFSDGQDIRSIAYRRKLGRGSMSVFVEVVQDKNLDDIVRKIAKLFNLVGSINIQLRLNNGQYSVFEINPRISSTVAIRHKMGFKDVIWWLQVLSNEPIGEYPGVCAGTVGIKFDNEQVLYGKQMNVQDKRNLLMQMDENPVIPGDSGEGGGGK